MICALLEGAKTLEAACAAADLKSPAYVRTKIGDLLNSNIIAKGEGGVLTLTVPEDLADLKVEAKAKEPKAEKPAKEPKAPKEPKAEKPAKAPKESKEPKEPKAPNAADTAEEKPADGADAKAEKPAKEPKVKAPKEPKEPKAEKPTKTFMQIGGKKEGSLAFLILDKTLAKGADGISREEIHAAAKEAEFKSEARVTSVIAELRDAGLLIVKEAEGAKATFTAKPDLVKEAVEAKKAALWERLPSRLRSSLSGLINPR